MGDELLPGERSTWVKPVIGFKRQDQWLLLTVTSAGVTQKAFFPLFQWPSSQPSAASVAPDGFPEGGQHWKDMLGLLLPTEKRDVATQPEHTARAFQILAALGATRRLRGPKAMCETGQLSKLPAWKGTKSRVVTQSVDDWTQRGLSPRPPNQLLEFRKRVSKKEGREKSIAPHPAQARFCDIDRVEFIPDLRCDRDTPAAVAVRDWLAEVGVPAEDRTVPANPTVHQMDRFDSDPCVGRDDELATLAKALSAQARRFRIYGPAGVGKSRIAVAFALANCTSREDVWFLTFREDRAIDTSLELDNTILEKMGRPRQEREGAARESVLKALSGKDRWFVFDNCETIDQPILADLLCRKEVAAHVVVTTQDIEFPDGAPNTSGFVALPLRHFRVDVVTSSSGAYACFRSYIKRRVELFDRHESEIVSLLKLTGGMPLAIRVVAIELDETMKLDGRGDWFRRELVESAAALYRARGAPDAGIDAVVACLRWSYERLRATDPICAEILRRLAVFDSEVDEDIAREVVSGLEPMVFQELINRMNRRWDLSVTEYHGVRRLSLLPHIRLFLSGVLWGPGYRPSTEYLATVGRMLDDAVAYSRRYAIDLWVRDRGQNVVHLGRQDAFLFRAWRLANNFGTADQVLNLWRNLLAYLEMTYRWDAVREDAQKAFDRLDEADPVQRFLMRWMKINNFAFAEIRKSDLLIEAGLEACRPHLERAEKELRSVLTELKADEVAGIRWGDDAQVQGMPYSLMSYACRHLGTAVKNRWRASKVPLGTEAANQYRNEIAQIFADARCYLDRFESDPSARIVYQCSLAGVLNAEAGLLLDMTPMAEPEATSAREKALVLAGQSAELSLKVGDRWRAAHSWGLMGKILRDLRRYDECYECLKSALDTSWEVGRFDCMRSALATLIEVRPLLQVPGINAKIASYEAELRAAEVRGDLG